MADRLGVSVREYDRLRGDAQQRFALSLFDTDTEGRPSPIETIAAPDVEFADAEAERASLYALLDSIVERLPEREQAIVQRYFFEGVTLREIAADLHLTEARISQILSKTLRGLRETLHDYRVAA